MIYLWCDGTEPTNQPISGYHEYNLPHYKIHIGNKITYLDVNIYKGPDFTTTHRLSRETYRINNYVYMQDPIILYAQRKE